MSHYAQSDSQLYQLPATAAAFTAYKQSHQHYFNQNRQLDQQQQQQQQLYQSTSQQIVANNNGNSNYIFQIQNADTDAISSNNNNNNSTNSINNYKGSASNSPSLLINPHFDSSEQKSFSRSQTNSPIDQSYLSSSMNTSNGNNMSAKNHINANVGLAGGSTGSPSMSLSVSTSSQSFTSPQSTSSMSSSLSNYADNTSTTSINNQLKHSLNMFVPFNNYV